MQKEKLTDAQRELVEANLGLARMVAWKYRESCARVGIDFDDAVSIACMGLIKGVRRYNPAVSKPSTYLSRGCELEIMMELRKRRQPCRCATLTISIDTPMDWDDEGHTRTLSDVLAEPGPTLEDSCIATILVDTAMCNLTPRQAEILRLMQEGLNQHEIGRIIGCSQSYVSRLVNACRKQVQEAIA